MEGNKEEYIRVGTCLYKIAQQPLANGTCTLRRIPWSFGTIRQDYGKNNTPPIRKYDGFCTVPSHTDYHKEIGGFYNLYEPIDHIPSEGEFPDIMKLMHHIFGEQYELGMDYMQLLYAKPTQKLPILLLTRVRDNILKSKEQKNIQPTKGGHKMVTCQNYVSLFYRQITSCPSDGGIS